MDSYTKTVLTVIAIVLAGLLLEIHLKPEISVHAQAPQPARHCEWTFLTDQGRPNLGENGTVDLKDPDWKKMSDGGWHLVTMGHNGVYMFEKCE